MDALSHALRSVRMTGAIFFQLECTYPWGFAVPPIDETAQLLSPGTERLLNYHLLTDGEARVELDGAEPIVVRAGEIFVMPKGDAHTVSRGAPSHIADSRRALTEAFTGAPRTLRMGGGGEPTRMVCGFFGCERHADGLFLAGLPPVFKINLRDDAAGAWLESSVRHLAGEAEAGLPGAAALLCKMAEALFIETLRRYTRELPDEQRGWLAGTRDRVVGNALALLHREPGRAWTVADLASAAGASRSVLGERFARFLGEPPLAYLARWRMQLAARALETTAHSVLEVAHDVGYQSEAAFNRAFKRVHGEPPAAYRRRLRDATS